MRQVWKQSEPESLTQERRDGNSFANLRKACKQAMQKALCAEQGYLCCFCESRIEASGEAMKIAHFVPQSVDASKSLEWDNLYGACYGNEPTSKHQSVDVDGARWDAREHKGRHCDAKQDQQVLDERLRPDKLSAGLIYFKQDGTVHSANSQIEHDLIVKLNLNHPRLVKNRTAAFDILINVADFDPVVARGLIGFSPDPGGRLGEFVSFLVAMVDQALGLRG